MAAKQHIIEKVKVDIDVDSMDLAEKIKSEINDFIQNEVLPIIESYFDELNLPQELKDKVIQLDKVNLSVDASLWNVHSNQLKQEIRSEVEKRMDPVIEDLKEKNLKHELSLPKGYDEIREESAQVYTKEERVLRSMFFFLDHGTLPWWVNSVEESRELFSEESLLLALRNKPSLARKEFETRRRDFYTRKRFVQQFPRSVVVEMILISASENFVQNEKVNTSAIQVIAQLPKKFVSHALSLIVELSEPRIIDEVFGKDAISTLFKHIHSHFFNAESKRVQLEASLETTISVLRFLYLLKEKGSDFDQAKPEFQKSLNEQLPSDILTQLKSTKTYQSIFLTANSITEEKAVDKSSELKKDTFSQGEITIDSWQELEKNAADSDSDANAQNEVSKSESSKESTTDEDSTDELQNSPTKEKDERRAQSEESIKESEIANSSDIDNNGSKLEDQSNDSEVADYRTNKLKRIEDEIPDPPVRPELDNGATNSDHESNEDVKENISEQDSQKSRSDQENELSKKETEQDKVDSLKSESKEDSDKYSNQLEASDANSEEGKPELTNKAKSESDSDSQPQSNQDKVKSDSEPESESESDSQSQSNQNKVKFDSDSQSQSNLNEVKSGEGEIEGLSKILNKGSEDLLRNKKKMDSMPNQLFVDNAGLVLLNPFLPALFKYLELVGEDGKLTDPALAACILHYAATGREGDFEFEMAFEKYLCGMLPTESLDREISLSDAQKEEVAKVLNSVLEHWSALRSKSPALLQNEFLTRAGKLIVEQSNHRLVIEKKTFDLLLDKLPWSYSMIKFSWKKDLIFVEW